MNIEQADLASVSREQIEAISEIRNATWAQVLPDDPPSPADELEADLRSVPSYERAVAWLARVDGRVAGACLMFWTTRDENRERGMVQLDVHPVHQRSGIATALLAEAASFAPSAEVTHLTSWVWPQAGGPEFCRRLGIEPEKSTFQGETSDYSGTQNRLYLEKVDRELVDRWVARAPDRASDYTLEFWVGPAADEDLPSLAKVALSMNTAPHSDGEEDTHLSPEELKASQEQTRDAGWTTWTMAARHKTSGEFGGYTVIYPPRFRPVAYQEDTGVLPEHRNRGLGRWLKAAMLIKLMQEHPETLWVETWNAPTNDPMLKINYELGFTAVITCTKYGVSVERLRASLARLTRT